MKTAFVAFIAESHYIRGNQVIFLGMSMLDGQQHVDI